MISLSMIEFQATVELFKYMPAFDAVELICSVFSTPQATLFVPITKTNAKMEVRQVVDLYEEYEIYCGLYAKDYKLTYYGGPPGMLLRYNGSLLTLVVDKFLRAHIAGHKTLTSRVLEYAHEQRWYNNHRTQSQTQTVGV